MGTGTIHCRLMATNGTRYVQFIYAQTLSAEVGLAYQTITNEQGLHADDLAVHLDMNRGYPVGH